MTQPPVLRNSPRSIKSATRQSGAGSSRVVKTITNPDLIAVTLFCLIGLLVTVNVVLRFPGFGLMVEQQLVFP